MPDREKVISAIENCIGQPKCRDCPWGDCELEHEVVNSVPYGLLRDALALLKEQEDLGTELTNAVELIHKKNERIEKLLKEQETQKFFVDESGKITPLPVVVRCKDCKWHTMRGEMLLCTAQNKPHTYDWFCADGERQEESDGHQ